MTELNICNRIEGLTGFKVKTSHTKNWKEEPLIEFCYGGTWFRLLEKDIKDQTSLCVIHIMGFGPGSFDDYILHLAGLK
jgi:hypothetical protein